MKINSEIYYRHSFMWFILLKCLCELSESKKMNNMSWLHQNMENFWSRDSLPKHFDRAKFQDNLLLSNPKEMTEAELKLMEQVPPIMLNKIPEMCGYELMSKKSKRGFSKEQQRNILDLHNLYRGKVDPPAGSMEFMEWDSELEHLAQLWADNCMFEHGYPENTTYRRRNTTFIYGQNLYCGTREKNQGVRGTYLWFNEYKNYNFYNSTCIPGEMCGHYITMVWDKARRLGCGMTQCGYHYNVVCHYFKRPYLNKEMYAIGRPCSQCPSNYGSLCKEKLCVGLERCKENPTLCENATCVLRCQNCGKLDKEKCTCECADGWDFADCSRRCTDVHYYCNKRPKGWLKTDCAMHDNEVGDQHCRKMCGKCFPYENGKVHKHICCGGKLCEDGFVLDTKRCTCRPQCHELGCDGLDDGVSSRISSKMIVLTVTILYFIAQFYLLNFILFP